MTAPSSGRDSGVGVGMGVGDGVGCGVEDGVAANSACGTLGDALGTFSEFVEHPAQRSNRARTVAVAARFMSATPFPARRQGLCRYWSAHIH